MKSVRGCSRKVFVTSVRKKLCMILQRRTQHGELLYAAQKLQKIWSTVVLYREVQCDLIAKEFSYHNYCYNLWTKPVYKDKECNADNYVDPESHFSAVVNFILSNVLENYQAVSMKTLTSLHNVKQGNDRRYRHKLKIKLKNRYWFVICYLLITFQVAESLTRS